MAFFQWVPGHEGIEGNERADREAKRAAEGEHRNRRHEHHRLLKGLQTSKSATKQKKTRKAYEKEFRTSPRYERSSLFDPKSPASNFMKIAMKLTRRQASILAQLCMSHTPLQAYLHCFKLAKSPICPSCRTEPETTTHFLMHCISYVAQKPRLRRTLGRDQSLGLEILGDEKRIKPLMTFINNMKRFADSHGDLHHGMQDEEGNG